ncbi:MAG TPA: UDP-3-O-(3-hydroxymyristoyl)glucosamine N-acyltransferase [Chlamydiales bacterium]|nr:UDP-3-O-(3-hydroxymyristoyl)glucosamine N-acyltransferase [Chlamydiales bacterium]
MKYQLKDLKKILPVQIIGNKDLIIEGVNSLDEAEKSDISFLSSPRYLEAMKKSKAGAICVSKDHPIYDEKNYIVCDNPSEIFQEISQLFIKKEESSYSGIHPTAIIHPSCQIGKNVTIGPYVTIDKNTFIDDNTIIDAHTTIYPSVVIGKDTKIYSSVTIRENSKIGNHVIIQPGAVIGSCGFGYILDEKGTYKKLEQLGNVIIEDHVEIGANTTIDRARFKHTIISSGTKIDNLVQIGHNVQIGKHNILCGQTGVAGSAKTGNYVVLGGQVGVLGHISIGDQSMVATRGGVSKSLPAHGKFRGSPAINVADYNKQKVHVRQLDKYFKKIKEIEEKLSKLDQI